MTAITYFRKLCCRANPVSDTSRATTLQHTRKSHGLQSTNGKSRRKLEYRDGLRIDGRRLLGGRGDNSNENCSSPAVVA
jgi:hypothetical protein